MQNTDGLKSCKISPELHGNGIWVIKNLSPGGAGKSIASFGRTCALCAFATPLSQEDTHPDSQEKIYFFFKQLDFEFTWNLSRGQSFYLQNFPVSMTFRTSRSVCTNLWTVYEFSLEAATSFAVLLRSLRSFPLGAISPKVTYLSTVYSPCLPS
jgi:hypothetical protein